MGSRKISPNDEGTRYPHPFKNWYSPGLEDVDEVLPGVEHPKTILELRMWALSSAIREKPHWWEDVKDVTIVAKWKKEALEQQKDLPKARALTERMIDHALAELFAHARIRERYGGIELGPYDRIWKSDVIIPEELRQELLTAATSLENIPDGEKYWRPGRDGQVLDLAHPSLYPVVYGRTHARSLEREGVLELTRTPADMDEDRDGYFTSQEFQWIASDFFVSADGKVKLDAPYINNINPATHPELYKVIPNVLERAVPLFEHVLSDLRRRLSPSRLEHDRSRCIWGSGGSYDQPERPRSTDLQDYFPPGYDPGDEDGEGYREAEYGYWFDRKLYLPDAKEGYDRWLDEIRRSVSLWGTRIQVIIKLTHITLTPEKPIYPGGRWQVEGMENESIIANFLYYYESENIDDSRLAFKLAVSEPDTHGPEDDFCAKALYGIDGEDPLAQEVGTVPTKGGRCIAFPNLYQHRVSPFRLEDPTKPGTQKIFTVCLCDPYVDVMSSSRVAPQQKEWVEDVVYNPEEGSLFARLPRELLELIVESVGGIMSRKEADEVREQLTRERAAFIDRHSTEFFGVEFNM